VERSKILLLANAGRTNQQIAAVLRTRTARVSKWRQRFGANRLEGLGDAARSGKPAMEWPVVIGSLDGCGQGSGMADSSPS
jgi:hypothetical protein